MATFVLYGAEPGILTVQQESTRMLQMSLGVTWEGPLQLCGPQGPPMVHGQGQGHCLMHPELMASPLTLREPSQDTARGEGGTHFMLH